MIRRAVLASDLSGVVLDFQPRRYLASRVGDSITSAFFAEVVTPAWFARGDIEPSLREMCATVAATRPEFEDCLGVWVEEYANFYVGLLPGAEEFLQWAANIGLEHYAASNAPAGVWLQLMERFPSLRLFSGAVISGEVGVAKPSGRFFMLLAESADLATGDRLLFLDDRADHCEAARQFGFDAINVRDSLSSVRAAVDAWLWDEDDRPVRDEC